MSDEIIQKVILNMLSTKGVFWASLLSQMTRVKCTNKTGQDDKTGDHMDTLGVTVKNGRIILYYNEDFLKTLTTAEARAVLEHECMHLAMEHISRKGNRDHKAFNIATDLAINQLIDGLPKNCVNLHSFPDEWKMPVKSHAEEYYDIIYKNSSKMKMEPNGKGGYKVTITDKNGNSKSFEIGDPCDQGKWEEADNEDITSEVVKQAIQQAVADHQRDKGTLPGGVEAVLEEMLRPAVIPWQQVLRRFVATSVKSGHKLSWKRPSRRYGEEQKGKLPDRKMALTLAIDTSGSINDSELQEFIDEIRAIQTSYKSTITIIECDSIVQKVYKLEKFGRVDSKFKGRGGTSFIPVFEYIKEKNLKTDALIYFTDLYGDWPQNKPIYPVLWVSTSGPGHVPWGQVLDMTAHREKNGRNR